MRLLEPLTPDPRAPLARAHPLAKIAAAFVVMLALFLTIDPLTPTLVLVAEIAAIPLIGVPAGALLRRALPVFVGAISIGFFNALLSGDIPGGVAIGLRLVGIALAGIVAIASIDPTDLADALVEHLHAPRRFTVGALAAFRLMPLFADEWQTIALARRARGLDNRRVTAFLSMTRSLLVAAIRRATRLAIAMDGRGFADPGSPCRTLARPRAIEGRDWWLIAASLMVAALASAASIAAGTWRFFLAR
ncbi:MAG: energy-coupling factor transporter transmembrane protein EcfT [Chloroflexota bacterium]|nr:energy-coupling factor transporter transmembrane protein EcfT [Chloroflexota bacterium]